MDDYEPRAVKVDDLIIDESSGEILELPENAGDVAEFLTYRLVTLQDAERAYKQAIVLLKLAIKRELDKLDLKSLQTQYGRPTIRTRTNRKGVTARVAQVGEDYELSNNQITAILACGAYLEAKLLEAVMEPAHIPREAIEALIEETHSEWVQISPILKAPPTVERP